jgi:hypothetical protein
MQALTSLLRHTTRDLSWMGEASRTPVRAFATKSNLGKKKDEKTMKAPEFNWRIMRIDDNGNTYEIEKFTASEKVAESKVRLFDDKNDGHKQMYYAEKIN